jgi:hypothetical protein
VFLQILINFNLINSLGEKCSILYLLSVEIFRDRTLTVNKEVLYLFVSFFNGGGGGDGSFFLQN